MSSILLLLEDGEMHPFVPGGASGGQIILARGGEGGSTQANEEQEPLTYTDAVITSVREESTIVFLLECNEYSVSGWRRRHVNTRQSLFDERRRHCFRNQGRRGTSWNCCDEA